MTAPSSADRLGKLAAEFVIIVVGVLAALAVDEWREELGDREQGAFYLAALEDDLQADSVTLEGAIERAASMGHAVSLLDSLVAGLRPPPDSATLAQALLSLGGTVDPLYRSATFEDLKSSGNTRLIENPDLRRRLMAYYTYVRESGTWLAEIRIGLGRVDLPVSLMTSSFVDEYAEFSRRFASVDESPVTDPRAALERLKSDSTTVLEWLRRRRISLSTVEGLAADVLDARTLPLLDDVRAERAGRPLPERR